MTPTVIAAGLEMALNQYLRLDPDIPPRLAALDGKVIAIEPGVGLSFYLLPSADGVRVVDRYEGEFSVRIRGPLVALARQWRDQRVDGGIAVEGDTAVGREFQTILAGLDIDWEEQLSRVVGDAAAHHLGNLWRGFRGWGRRTFDILSRDGAEYLQQELRALPPRHAVERFLSAVDILREDADRLAVRIERLRRQIAAGSA
jgi:ubiquinone biosynthesis protein UbiJ